MLQDDTMVKDSVKFLVDTMIKHARLNPSNEEEDQDRKNNTVRIPSRGKIPQRSRDPNCLMC